jgi:hypothetical protein
MLRSTTRTALALIGLFAFLGLAACAPTVAVRAAPTSTPVPATATTSANCSAVTTDPLSPPAHIPFSLPPNTVWKFTSGAAGTGFYSACTPGATQDAIDTFLNAALPRAGWQRWDPQTENAHGCGTEPNDFWRWSKSGEAVGWSATGPMLPSWELAFCNLAYGR